ncbi:MAG: MFS transporter [Coriobacteriales bacterium]|nr:MFS transporter [Coriobacteriales bacterium]
MDASVNKSMRFKANKAYFGSLIMAAFCLGSYITFSNYWNPLAAKLGVSLGQISIIISIASLTSVITALVLGALLKRIKIRLLVSIAAVIIIAFFVAISLATDIIALYIMAIPFGFATVAAGFPGAQVIMAWWFKKGLGKRMSFLAIGLALVIMTLSPTLAASIEAYSVSQVALVHGLVAGGVILLCAIFLLAEKPSEYGYEVPDEKPKQVSEAEAGQIEHTADKTLTVKEILRTKPFWMILIGIFVACIATTGLGNNSAPFFESLNLSPVEAGICVGALGIATLVWGPVFGVLLDKFGVSKATTMQGGLLTVVFFAAAFVAGLGFIPALIIAVMLDASAFTGNLGAVAYTKIYGQKESASLIGFASTASASAAMVGTPLAAFIFTATNSYMMFMFFSGILVAVCVVLVILATRIRIVKPESTPGQEG